MPSRRTVAPAPGRVRTPESHSLPGALQVALIHVDPVVGSADEGIQLVDEERGIREVMQAQGSVWELKLVELMTTIMGGGLLGGCIALILDRIKKS